MRTRLKIERHQSTVHEVNDDIRIVEKHNDFRCNCTHLRKVFPSTQHQGMRGKLFGLFMTLFVFG